MSKSLDSLRDDHSDFNRNQEQFIYSDPFLAFSTWFDLAVSSGENEANAMVIATVNSSLQPTTRVVYLKELIDHSFVFYTNYESAKGKDLVINPKASILFFWPGLERQIRIEGEVQKVPDVQSDAYFASRPRESQLGAWVSQQSETLESMSELKDRFELYDKKYPSVVPRPPHWGGYALLPRRFEFWQGKPSRLHERVVFEKKENNWAQFRLNP